MSEDRKQAVMAGFIGLGASFIVTILISNWLFPYLSWWDFPISHPIIALVVAVVFSLKLMSYVYRRHNKKAAKAYQDRQLKDRSVHLTVGTFYVLLGILLVTLNVLVPGVLDATFLVALTAVGMPIILRIIRGSVETAEDETVEELKSPQPVHDRIRRNLAHSAGEKASQGTRRHPILLVPPIIGMLVVSYLVRQIGLRFESWELAVGIWVIAALIAGVVYLKWHYVHFAVTNMRLLLVYQVFGDELAMMPLSKVTDMKRTIPWHSRLLAGLRIIREPYGTFVLESAGQDQALRKVTFVPKARSIYLATVGQALG